MNFTIKNNSDKTVPCNYISKLNTDGNRRFTVSVKLLREIRSVDQNRLMWLWFAHIADETGNDRNTIHEFFKDEYLQPEIRFIFGKNIEIEPSTTKLDTAQFAMYLKRIQQYSESMLGIILPDPPPKGLSPEEIQRYYDSAEFAAWQHFEETYKNFI